jgi:predicted metal-dependent hydrolase
VQFELKFGPWRISPGPPHEAWLRVGGRQVRLRFVRNRRARRYVLRLRPDGIARVTIPRGGTALEAKRFAERNGPWLAKQLLRQASQPRPSREWLLGTELLFRGERVRLEVDLNGEPNVVRFGSQVLIVNNPTQNLRPEVEYYLRRLAGCELSARVHELAALHGVEVERVSIRNQRSRWGSCSRSGTVSLNWRLVQTPEFVRDYIILHELAHFKEMNHSARFWREVGRLCPDFVQAQQWLKANKLDR